MLTFKSVQPTCAFAFGRDVPILKLDYSGLVVLHGANGAGKSSIMNSIVHPLFGRNDTAGSGDEIANHLLKDGCLISVGFDVNGASYLVEYCRRYKRPESTVRETDLFFYQVVDDARLDQRGESMADTQAKIQRVIGMDFKRFQATSYLSINAGSVFLNGTDQECMAIITPFLGLEIWNDAQEIVRGFKKGTLDDLAQRKGSLDYIVASIGHAESKIMTAEQTTDIKDHATQSRESISVLNRQSESIRAVNAKTLDVRNRTEKEFDEVSRRVSGAKSELARLASAYERSKFIIAQVVPEVDRTEVVNLVNERTECRVQHLKEARGFEIELAQVKSLNPSVQGDTEHTKLLDKWKSCCEERSTLEAAAKRGVGHSAVCPTCGTRVDWDSFNEKLGSLARICDELGANVDRSREELFARFEQSKTEAGAALQRRIDEAKTVYNSFTKLMDDQITKLEDGIREQIAKYRTEELARLEATFSVESGHLQAEVDKLTAECDKARIDHERALSDPALVRSDILLRDIALTISLHISAISGLESQILVSKRGEEELARLVSHREEAEGVVSRLSGRIDDLEFLDRHLGDKGIKRHKLRSCLDFMNAQLEYAIGVMGLSMRVWFQDREVKKSSQRKRSEVLTDEDYIDRFAVYVADGAKCGVPIGMYSGGERTLVSLAVLGTLWMTANTFGQSGSNLLLVDEPFGLLQEDNADRALALLEYWASLGKCVVVSDNTGRIDALGHRAATWKVTKTDHVSTVEVVDG